MTKKLHFENTKPPEIFHFPNFFFFGKKSSKNFNFHFTIASWVFIRFWRLYPQNFRNWFCFSNLLKHLKNCGLNKPKISKIDFGLFGFFPWEFTTEFCILNHKNHIFFHVWKVYEISEKSRVIAFKLDKNLLKYLKLNLRSP